MRSERNTAGEPRRFRLRRTTGMVAVLALAATACGTRLSDPEIRQEFLEARGQGSGAAGQVPADDASGDSGPSIDSGPALSDGDSTTTELEPGPGSTQGPTTDGTTAGGDTGATTTGGTTGGGDTGGTDGGTTGGTTGGGDTGGTDGGTTGGDSGGTADGGGQENFASDQGVSADTIKVGNITSRGGPLGDKQFNPPFMGANAYFARLNAEGGINGRQIEFITCSDQEDRSENLRCAQRLNEQEQVFALVANNTRAYSGAEYVSDNGLPDIGGIPIGNEYYQYPGLFTILGSKYERDGTIGDDGYLYWHTGWYDWFKQNAGVTKAAVVYYSIPISKQAGQLTARALRENGLETIEIELNAGLPQFDTAVARMQEENVDGVWDTIDVTGNQNLCKQMQQRSFQPKAKVSTISTWARSVKDDFSDICRPVMYVGGGSRPISDTSDPEIQKFHDTMRTVYGDGYEPWMQHQWAYEGWLAAKLFHEGVERMGAEVTQQGLIDWMRSLQDWTADGQRNPTDWQPRDWSNPPSQQCSVIAQWDDEQNVFATRENVQEYCPTGEWMRYEPVT